MYPLPPGAANCSAYSGQLRAELEAGSGAACEAGTPLDSDLPNCGH